MRKCFVIQPFDDGGKFDKRFVETYKPAIEAASMTAYRVDTDYSVRIPAQEIEKGIRESSLCFAEITTDNPNVWYELGFAFACHIDVVMVCEENSRIKFPFDVQHKSIIEYKTGAPSDFTQLGNKITERIHEYLRTSSQVEKLHATPVVETEGLKSHEIALLLLVLESNIAHDDGVSTGWIQRKMEESGYTTTATAVGLITLGNAKMIVTEQCWDEQYDELYKKCKLTESGRNWILSNQGKLEFRSATTDSGYQIEIPF